MIKKGAAIAVENVEVRPDLPVYFSPGYSVCFSHESYKFFEVPRPVDDVLGPYLAIVINVALGLVAVKNLALAHSE